MRMSVSRVVYRVDQGPLGVWGRSWPVEPFPNFHTARAFRLVRSSDCGVLNPPPPSTIRYRASMTPSLRVLRCVPTMCQPCASHATLRRAH